jgi:hypothetical protein
LFLAADGLHNNSIESWRDIPENYTFIGCLAGAYSRHSQTYQVGGHDCGAGGLAIAYLGPEVACGASVAHGWQPVGESFQVTEVEGLSILSLDGKTPVEAYSGLFGYPGTQWTVPPLNELVRLYPFAVQTEIEKTIVVRSPMKVEEYGVIRMQAPVSEHAFIHLMIGNREDCLAAAEKATREALNELDGAKPVLAIVLTDISWRMLMETQPGAELKTIRNIIGAEVPIVGGYVFGQLLGKSGQSAELYNQHIEVVLLGKGN